MSAEPLPGERVSGQAAVPVAGLRRAPIAAEPLDEAEFIDLRSSMEPVAPMCELVFEIVVDTGAREDLGVGPYGERRFIPILGGRFTGPGIRGEVMPGGADRQIVRHDGVRELEAIYELRADDGTVLSVLNRVIIDESVPDERYARSVVRITAPDGPHE